MVELFWLVCLFSVFETLIQVIADLNLFLTSNWNACLRFFTDFCIIFVRSLTHAIKVVQVGEEVCDILIIRRFLENVNNEFGSDETKF